MLTKSLLFALLLAVSWQFNAADEKFDSHKDFVRHGAGEFVRDTYGSIIKGLDMTEKLYDDLKAYEPKTEEDEKALLRLEILVEKMKKGKDLELTEENMGLALEIILSTILSVANYRTKEDEFILKSAAVKELIKKYSFDDLHQGFLDSFKTFADKFTKETEEFLSYADKEKANDIPVWLEKFKAENDIKKKLQMFIALFVNVGQFDE